MKKYVLAFTSLVLMLSLVGCSASSAATKRTGDTTGQTENAPTRITREEAKAQAFTHAQVNENQVSDLVVELDKENGRLYYEVSFDAAGYEYDYDIDAYTGKVLRHQKERND